MQVNTAIATNRNIQSNNISKLFYTFKLVKSNEKIKVRLTKLNYQYSKWHLDQIIWLALVQWVFRKHKESKTGYRKNTNMNRLKHVQHNRILIYRSCPSRISFSSSGRHLTTTLTHSALELTFSFGWNQKFKFVFHNLSKIAIYYWIE
jgi:hypothetical protein